MFSKEKPASSRTLVLEGLSVAVSDFYSLVEAIIRSRALPRVKVKRILLPEGGIFGAKREYLRVRRGRREILVGASAFGQSFMVTETLRQVRRPWFKWIAVGVLVCSYLDVISERLYWAVVNVLGCFLVPVIGFVVVWFLIRRIPGARLILGLLRQLVRWTVGALSHPTLYQAGGAAAFEKAVPLIVDEAIGALRNARGLRALPSGQEDAGSASFAPA